MEEDEAMDFGKALEAIKNGKKAKRRGWNGKEQYICLGENFTYERDHGTYTAIHHDIGGKAIVFVGIRGVQVGWLASQADMLADDWEIVE